MAKAWINGKFVKEESASVSIRDTGLLHSIGVFTTMRAVRTTVLRLEQHLARLRESCEILFIPLMYKDTELKEAIEHLLSKNGIDNARLRLTITRGTTVVDPVHGPHAHPTAILTAGAFEPYPAEYYQKGLTVIVLDEQKLNPYDLQAGHKTLDYMSRLSALREANRRGAGEALWFNVHNYLQSGSISNVFVVKDGQLLTPPTNIELRDIELKSRMPYDKSNVLPGTTRGAVLEAAAKASIPLRLAPITINELLEADEVFLTNSVMGVMPVCRIERKAIANEQPGPITKRMAGAWNGIVNETR